MITLTKTAVEEIKRIQKSRQKPQSHLRLKIAEGGCSGLFYQLGIEENVESRDFTQTSEGIVIVIDPQSYQYVSELNIDYSEDLMGGSFRFDNPNAIKHCSCGQSFSWQNS